MSILEKIHGRDDLLRLSPDEERRLCGELRAFLVEHVSKTGGHLASNLGVVEMTVALHKVFDTSRDRSVFDVGHQSYVHKILTGRADRFDTLRCYNGLCGFLKPSESIHDSFITGHASTSVSAALGMARARTLSGEDYSVVAVLGDGALTGGLAYEGLNDAGESGEPMIVILNDNGMSIAKNVGAISNYLACLRLKPHYFRIKKAYRSFTEHVPGGKRLYAFTHRLKQRIKEFFLGSTMFEEMGFTYLGPVDGHDINRLCYLLQWALELKCPVLLHVTTVKGDGYSFAEQNPDEYHGVRPFNPETGAPVKVAGTSFSGVFGDELQTLARKDPKLCAITAAMPDGTSLCDFAMHFPKRFFDVGIAEGHATTMSAGLAKQGMHPVFAVYSSFLQRGFDMLLHDVAIDHLHVVFAVDRAGLVGEDGATHHGVFDVGFLRQVPGMTVLCPATFEELRQMLRIAIYELEGPVAVRYPRGGEGRLTGIPTSNFLRTGTEFTLAGYGTMLNRLLDAADLLEADGVSIEVVRLDRIKPLEVRDIFESVQKTGRLLFAEDAPYEGSVGQEVAARLAVAGISCELVLKNLGDRFVPHGAVETLIRAEGLDSRSLADAVKGALRNEK